MVKELRRQARWKEEKSSGFDGGAREGGSSGFDGRAREGGSSGFDGRAREGGSSGFDGGAREGGSSGFDGGAREAATGSMSLNCDNFRNKAACVVCNIDLGVCCYLTAM